MPPKCATSTNTCVTAASNRTGVEMKISTILDSIDSGRMVLSEFQRSYEHSRAVQPMPEEKAA